MQSVLLLLLVGASTSSVGSSETPEDNQEHEETDYTYDEDKWTSNTVAEWIDGWLPYARQNIWERSGLFEGDIMEDTREVVRNGQIDNRFLWPGGEVPFVISPVFRNSEREVILGAMNEIKRKTCVSFRPRSSRDTDYLTIGDDRSKPGCWSFVGRKGNDQHLNLRRPWCLEHSVVVHELLHSLGLFHQQSASNRDDYVQIHWQNIEHGQEDNFEKQDPSTVASYGVPYDYNSIMHYGTHAFSRNREPTITPLKEGVEIGVRKNLSRGDVAKINIMYNCNSSG
ncbi:hypothetical protein J6590_095018 [Homalodisca vitripennis]|nr:hypothetical protein J6590_095018 [Homalodisca vitripennis]